MNPSALLDSVPAIARRAGTAILVHYGKRVEAERKIDSSPVTAADREAEWIIAGALRELTPAIAVVAEKEVSAGTANRGMASALGWWIVTGNPAALYSHANA